MNRRGKRLTLGVMMAGLVVVLVLAVAHWDTVRDHVEAWRFQLTRKTVSIEPEPALREQTWSAGSGMNDRALFGVLANHSGIPVVFDLAAPSVSFYYREEFSRLGEGAIENLKRNGFRILEQRFPRRAYVVIPHGCGISCSTSSTSGEGCDVGITIEITPTVSQ